MNNEVRSSSFVIDFIASMMVILQLVLVILKIAGSIDWSWWIVLIPLWMGLGFLALMFTVGAVIGYKVTKNMKKKMDNLTK